MEDHRCPAVRWTRFSTLVWSLSCYPNTNKQRGTLELMTEEGVGGVSEGGLCAPDSRSPKKWRTAHFQPQLRTGLPRCCCCRLSVPQTFHRVSQLVTALQKSEASGLAAWRRERFMDLDPGKVSALYWSSSPVLVSVDYWHTAGPLAAFYWGKILFGRVHVGAAEGTLLLLRKSECYWSHRRAKRWFDQKLRVRAHSRSTLIDLSLQPN